MVGFEKYQPQPKPKIVRRVSETAIISVTGLRMEKSISL